MRQIFVLFLFSTLALGCASSNTHELAQLRAELKADRESLAETRTELIAERELLAKTRAELSEVVTALVPLIKMAQIAGSFAEDNLAHNYSLADGEDIPDNYDTAKDDKDQFSLTTSDSAKEELKVLLASGVRLISPTECKVTRSFVDKVLENPMVVARGARIVPSIKGGKSNGFKFYAIRPGSIYASIGIMNGDTIHQINGFDLSSPDRALEIYSKIRNASVFNVDLTRRGKPVQLRIRIVDSL